MKVNDNVHLTIIYLKKFMYIYFKLFYIYFIFILIISIIIL